MPNRANSLGGDSHIKIVSCVSFLRCCHQQSSKKTKEAPEMTHCHDALLCLTCFSLPFCVVRPFPSRRCLPRRKHTRRQLQPEAKRCSAQPAPPHELMSFLRSFLLNPGGATDGFPISALFPTADLLQMTGWHEGEGDVADFLRAVMRTSNAEAPKYCRDRNTCVES